MKKLILIAAILTMASGCKEIDKTVVGGKLKDLWPQVSNNEFLRVRGVGVPPEKAKGLTRRRGLSRNAALVSARYEMLATIKGVKVSGGLTIGELMQKDGSIKEMADRIISGAVEAQAEWASDDGCVVVLELRRDQIAEILERGDDEPTITTRALSDIQAVLSQMPGLAAVPVRGGSGPQYIYANEADASARAEAIAQAIIAKNIALSASTAGYFPGGTGLGLTGR